MPAPPFQPNGAVRFDLRKGEAADSRGERLVLVPSAALLAVPPDALAALGTAIGRACGERVADRLGGASAVRDESIELVLSHLAGELALCGVGVLHLERWGRALVTLVSNAGVDDDGFVAGVLSAAVSAASGRDVAAAALGHDASCARFFLGSPRTAARVRTEIQRGSGFASVLQALQASSASQPDLGGS